MSSARRVATAAEMQARDLFRRYLAIAFIVALPLVFYFALLPGNFAFYLSSPGLAWSVSASGLFAVLASRHTDPRLVLSGYRPWELLLGRWLLLEGSSVVLIGAFSALYLATSHPIGVTELLLGVALTGVIAVPLGLVVGALLPRELEGTIVIIAIVGIEMSLSPGSSIAKYLPLYGPQQLLATAAGLGDASPPPVWASIVHALAYTVGLTLFASLLWTIRVRTVDVRGGKRPG